LEQVGRVLEFAVGDTVPDLTLLFEVSSEVSEERRRRRLLGEGAGPGGLADRFEDEARAFHDRVAAGFRAIAASEKGRVVVIDATPGVEEVAESVWRVVEERMRAVNRMG
jgi:dTMP kinase